MDTAQGQGSEVARILQQIREEYDAALRGLTGTASGTTRHAFITARMEHIGRLHEELKEIVGEPAIALIADELEGGSDATSSAVQEVGVSGAVDGESTVPQSREFFLGKEADPLEA